MTSVRIRYTVNNVLIWTSYQQGSLEWGRKYKPHKDRDCKRGLSLLTVSNQTRLYRWTTALCNVPRCSWLRMFGIAHVMSCLISDADGPKYDQTRVNDHGYEWMEYGANEHDALA